MHFSISTYAGYVGCDVVPLQPCPLLLSRPWQFDKKYVRHGRNNQYTLVHKDKNITLLPMTPDSILKDDIKEIIKQNRRRIRVKIRLWQKNLSKK